MKNMGAILILSLLSLITIGHCAPNNWLSLLQNHPFKLHAQVSADKASSRVSGGDAQTDNHYNFQVQLTDSATSQHICGAVVIDANWALTAAHCVNGRDGTKLTIPIDSRFAGTPYTAMTMQVGEIKIHPSYAPETMANNLALVRITPAVMLDKANARIVAVTLPEAGQKFTDELTLVGFGSISNIVPREEAQKRIVSIPTAALTRCRNLYSQNLISEGMLCAGNSYTGKGLCQGDAGSGLTQFDQELNVEVLVGIGSFGFDCGNGRYPSVFTEVSNYISWIRETIPAASTA